MTNYRLAELRYDLRHPLRWLNSKVHCYAMHTEPIPGRDTVRATFCKRFRFHRGGHRFE
jgi:hypothetical protein